jgi:hypothetical protein
MKQVPNLTFKLCITLHIMLDIQLGKEFVQKKAHDAGS